MARQTRVVAIAGDVVERSHREALAEGFATWLSLPHGIPAHDTFGRLFAWLEPHKFMVVLDTLTAPPFFAMIQGGLCRQTSARAL